jgi:hypothetical protein
VPCRFAAASLRFRQCDNSGRSDKANPAYLVYIPVSSLLNIFMNNRNLVRGLFLMAIALVFGVGALQYNIGQFSHSGPGLFPLMVSCLLFLIGLLTLVRSRFVAPVALNYNSKNIALILLSLCGLVVLSKYLNMTVGIVFLVFCSTFAGTSYSVSRNVKISAGLIAIAFGFEKLLGLNLPLL